MSLHDTEAEVIETGSATESLPDPTLVNGRLHQLINTGTVTAVWSSVGATPFSVGGVNSATVSIARGNTLLIQSDGVRWIAKSSGQRPFFAGTAITDAAGNVTFTFPTPFAVVPVVEVAIQTAASTNPIDYRITAVSTTAVTINVKQSIAIVVALLGLTLLQIPANVAGITVHAFATPPGQTP